MGDNVEIINILADFQGWCADDKVRNVFQLIKSVLEVLRYVVPIALIIMTSLDVAKKVINPTEQEGQKKIMYRAIGALIVFLAPTIIGLIFKLIDIGKGSGNTQDEAKASMSSVSCWW